MVDVHLVRHARSEPTPGHPASDWGLAPDAGVGVAALKAADVVPAGALWACSDEPKAVATARLLGGVDVRCEPALREAARDATWLAPDEWARLVLASFAEPDVSARGGWEPLTQTRARGVRATQSVVADARAAGRDVVLVGHGTAWTLLVAAMTGRSPDVHAWQNMRMPDHCALRWPDRIVAPWGAWAT
jgi:broad specificity phosphatase PhoE